MEESQKDHFIGGIYFQNFLKKFFQ